MSFRMSLAVWITMAGTVLFAQDVPNLSGSYLGAFLPAGATSPHTAILPHVEQDNLRRLTGSLVVGQSTFPLAGTIAASGHCTCIGSGDDKFVYQAQWEKLGNGAGALFGNAAITTRDGKSTGTLFLFRPMTTTARPAVQGSYAGNYRSTVSGVTGSVAVQITDGTSNTLVLNLAFTSGRTTTHYACTGDVNSDGIFVGIGIAVDGSVAIVRGYIEQDNLRRPLQLNAEVQLKSPAGKLLDTNSIIAILIG